MISCYSSGFWCSLDGGNNGNEDEDHMLEK